MSKKEDLKDQDIHLENQQATSEVEQKESKKEKKDAPKKSDLEIAKEELATEKDKFLRLFAEFENYKKRTSRERIELFKTAGQEVISSLLPVVDDFDRAIKEIAKSDNGESELFKGVSLINDKLISVLKNQGLSAVEVNQGDVFDAEIHEAITQIPAPTDDLKGKIVDVIEKGYTLGEKVIRHPKVVVGN